MLEKLSGETFLYPIIGDPISFVKSPQHMTAEFERRGHNGICVPMKVPDGALDDFVRAVRPVANIRGLLVTMPHKNAMFAHCASASETPKLLGVVSIAKRNSDGTWHGEMLDGIAFVSAMKHQGAKPAGARVLQVGVGGAGSAIAVALLDAGVQELVLHDTNQPRLNNLIQLLSRLSIGSVVAGPPNPDGCDIVVNATPLGMHPNDPLPVEAHLLTSSMFVADVIAGHGVTPFMQTAHRAGCPTSDGVGMVEAGIKLMSDFLLGQQSAGRAANR